jgi:hypothetical protein
MLYGDFVNETSCSKYAEIGFPVRNRTVETVGYVGLRELQIEASDFL